MKKKLTVFLPAPDTTTLPTREELEYLRNENALLERDNKILAAELEYLRKRVRDELEPRLAKEREAYEEWAKVVKALHPEKAL